MEIGTIGNTPVSPLAASSANGTLGKNEFLQLLVSQLQNQDPLNPVEGTEFATQLAQFNSVEQLINLNAAVESLAFSQSLMSTGLNNSLASNLAGRSVRAFTQNFGFDGKNDVSVHLKLPQLMEEVEVVVRDANGSIVKTESLKNLGKGDFEWKWDGKNDRGNKLPEGVYTVEAASKSGELSQPILTFLEGIVDKVRFGANGVTLLVGGVEIALGDIEEIGK